MSFELHPQLADDTAPVTDLAVCRVLLMDDSNWPWLIMVPALPGLKDLHDLPADQDGQVMAEIRQVSRALTALHNPDKLNVAALGNQVPQLHIHVIARRRTDPGWPGPIWGKAERIPYSTEALAAEVTRHQSAIEDAA